MTKRNEHDRLFADALADDTPAGFRDALLTDTLQRVRTRRVWRRTRRALGALACLAVLGVAVSMVLRKPVEQAIEPTPSYNVVQTQPLPAAAIVTSSVFAYETLTAVSYVTVIATQDSLTAYHEMTDDQLLALITPRLAALVRCGPHCAELVFLNPDDEHGFPVY